MAYAQRTKVPESRSKAEIDQLLEQHGCDGLGNYAKGDKCNIMFEIGALRVRVDVEFPPRSSFASTETGLDRSESAADQAFSQERRRIWRAMLLSIKAKLTSIESGISTIEQEFLPFVVCDNDKTLGEQILPKLLEARTTGKLLPLKKLLQLPA